MKALSLALLFIVSLTTSAIAQQFTPPAMPPGAKGQGERFESNIEKIYSLDDQGSVYRAYVVKYKGSEVVVPDLLAQTPRKVGDKVTVIAARVEMPFGGTTLKTISFQIMPSGAPKK